MSLLQVDNIKNAAGTGIPTVNGKTIATLEDANVFQQDVVIAAGKNLVVKNTANTFETTIDFGEPTSNKVFTLPETGQQLAGANSPDFSYKSTPVSITSWSYVTTTITLNVASHTFVAGDYIEVSGLTATTNIPNGVHLVTSVTATTIVFTYALTPTGTAGVSSATVKGYMTTNGRTNGIGEGQTWQDVTASRATGTTYTNTTGKPISIYVLGISAANSTSPVTVTVNGVSLGTIQWYGGASAAGHSPLSIVIPNMGTYSVTAPLGITAWSELR